MGWPSPCHGRVYLGQTVKKKLKPREGSSPSESFKTAPIGVNSMLYIQVNVLGFLLLKHQNIVLEISMTIRQ